MGEASNSPGMLRQLILSLALPYCCSRRDPTGNSRRPRPRPWPFQAQSSSKAQSVLAVSVRVTHPERDDRTSSLSENGNAVAILSSPVIMATPMEDQIAGMSLHISLACDRGQSMCSVEILGRASLSVATERAQSLHCSRCSPIELLQGPGVLAGLSSSSVVSYLL